MKIIPPGRTIGIIGGGQLGRMTALAAANLGYKTHIFSPEKDCPASQVAFKITCAPYEDKEALRKFSEKVDVISFEFENIPNDTVVFLEEMNDVRPGSKVLYTAQNRLREKAFFNKIGVPTNRYISVESADSLISGFNELGGRKAVLKTTELGYDGKGQAIIETGGEWLKEIWNSCKMKNAILEEYIDFSKEISAIVARGIDGKSLVFPIGENKHSSGILDSTVVPASIGQKAEREVERMAIKIAEELGLIGILAIEFFVTNDGNIIANEMAPRPHNSGHWTMDGCITSQFEQFVRAICGLPLGSVRQHSSARMRNLIGEDVNNLEDILNDEFAKLHLYGKKEARPGRKMGHVNYVLPLNRGQ